MASTARAIGLAILVVGVLACWSWSRFGPVDVGDADGDGDGDADGDGDGGDAESQRTCAELGGAACADGELCLRAPVQTLDAEACCPEAACLEQGAKRLVEASLLEEPPTIDGLGDEWVGLERQVLAEQRHPDRLVGEGDLAARFAVAWAPGALCLLVEVTDDEPREPDSIPPVDARVRPWHDDGLEIFLDMDPRDGTPAYELDENQLFATISAECFERDDTEGHESEPDRGWTLRAAVARTATGWVAEVAVDWPDHVEGVPEAEPGLVVGFDLLVNDDDEQWDALSENTVGWSAPAGSSPTSDTTLFGLLRLGGGGS